MNSGILWPGRWVISTISPLAMSPLRYAQECPPNTDSVIPKIVKVAIQEIRRLHLPFMSVFLR
jgi:hypothetical protein